MTAVVASSETSSLLSYLNPWYISRDIWRHRDLSWQMAVREIELRHRGSRLGAVWALFNPLSMLALYWFLFGVIFKGNWGVLPHETQLDYVLGMFLGIAMFQVFAEMLGWGPIVITSNPNYVKKVVFPLEILPVAKVGDSGYHLAATLLLVVVGSFFGSIGITWGMLWMPVLILPLLLIALGIGWIMAAIGVFVRDIAQLTAFFATALQVGSAVMFPPEKMKDLPYVWDILKFNPLLQILDIGRRTVLWNQPMNWYWLAYIYAFALASVMVGHACFMVLRKSFAEVI